MSKSAPEYGYCATTVFMATFGSARGDRDAWRRSVVLATCRHAAWAVIAGCGVMVVLLGIVSTGRRALGTAERNGARLATDTSPAPEGAR